MNMRPNHIFELTKGIQLPLPKISDDILEIIASGIIQAFNEVMLSHPNDMCTGTEAEVTALLQARLNNLIQEDFFLSQLVSYVGRGVESLSFDGVHLEKRPDLSLVLTSSVNNFPLIVEAKIIDRSNGKTEQLYCDKGLRRFIDGEYAWGNQEAFLVAYVRDKSTINLKLTPYLAAKLNTSPNDYQTIALPTLRGGEELATSQHDRVFQYIHQKAPNNRPGSISLWHIWLS
ncbi:TPA: hypothetical protein ACKEVR_003799 [Acinetobacter baumannii]